jgi:hypothetical protein
MWETIKNDPILKTVTIIILSILGFGFAFNIMFGANRAGMGDMGGGYSLENTLSYILAIGVKVLLIALVIAAIVAVFKLAKGHIGGGENIKMFDSIKKDPVLKWTITIVLAILALGLIHVLFRGMSGNGNSYVMTSNGGYSLGISGLIAHLLKFLLFISVIGLVIGAFMYIKQNYSKEIISKVSSLKSERKSKVKCSKCNTETVGEFKFCPSCGEKLKEECESCGTELKSDWKCCPGCGTEKGVRA